MKQATGFKFYEVVSYDKGGHDEFTQLVTTDKQRAIDRAWNERAYQKKDPHNKTVTEVREYDLEKGKESTGITDEKIAELALMSDKELFAWFCEGSEMDDADLISDIIGYGCDLIDY